jgi:hypothetical protein
MLIRVRTGNRNSMKWELEIAAGAVLTFCPPGASNVVGKDAMTAGAAGVA